MSYGAWRKLEVSELQAYYAIRTFIELFCKDRVDSIWNTHDGDDFFLLRIPGVSKVFTLKRYKQISKYVHYYRPGIQPDGADPTRDRAFKIRSLVNHMKEAFQKYYECSENIVIDEYVVPFRGRLGIKLYFKDKPVKWGIKLWMLCDSTSGYCHNFDLHSGKDVDFNDLETVSITSAVVIKLCQSMYDSGRVLYTDRYYTSPILAYYLGKLGLRVCGTSMTKVTGFPEELVTRRGEEQQGSYEWLQCQTTGILATRWVDKLPVYFVSTGFVQEQTTALLSGVTRLAGS